MPRERSSGLWVTEGEGLGGWGGRVYVYVGGLVGGGYTQNNYLEDVEALKPQLSDNRRLCVNCFSSCQREKVFVENEKSRLQADPSA